jgi:hypothetical protein
VPPRKSRIEESVVENYSDLYQRRKTMKNNKIYLIVFLFIFVLSSCNSNNNPSNISSGNQKEISSGVTPSPKKSEPPPPEASDDVSVPYSVSLSSEAKEVSALIDKGSLTAAEQLLNAYLPKKPSDASLYCQYTRYLIKAYSMNTSKAIISPIASDGKDYYVKYLMLRSTSLAVEFDSTMKPYLADIILKEIYDKIYEQMKNKQAFITEWNTYSNDYNNGNASTSLAWEAIKLDTNVGKKWAKKYESLAFQLAKLGFPSSALMTANLSGDLTNGADIKSNEDFNRATQMFLAAIETKTCVVKGKNSYGLLVDGGADSIDDAVDLYTEYFKDDAKRAFQEKNETFLKLLKAIKNEGVSLKPFEDSIPSSIIENSNTSANSAVNQAR